MKTKRIFALLLAALMIVGLFAGCSKDGTKDPGKTDPGNSLIDQTKPAATTAKYAYQADYLDLAMPVELPVPQPDLRCRNDALCLGRHTGRGDHNTDSHHGETGRITTRGCPCSAIDLIPACAPS